MTTQNHRGDKMERNETVTKVVEEEVVKGTLWKCGTVCPRRITDKKMTRKERECKEEKRQRKERKVQGIVKVRNSMIRKITKQYKIKILQIKYDHVGTKRGRDFWKCGTIWSRRITNIFFLGLCCARHYNCGSHWTVLVMSLLDNEIKRKGQWPKKTRQQNPQKHPTNKHQNQTTDPSLTNRVKGETRWNKLRLSRKLQSPALTTSSAGNSQRPMQCVVTQ